MPVVALSPDEIDAAMEAGDSAIKYLLDKGGVEREVQARLYHFGCTSVALLGTFAENAADFKAMLKDDFGLDPSKSIGERAQVAQLLVAFNTAQVRATKQAEVEGELESRRMTRPLPANEYVAMRMAFEKQWWVLEEDQVPARSFLERLADELETGDFKCTPLETVLNKEQDDPDVLTPVWTATGQLQMKRGAGRIAEPANPEALRKRVSLLGVALMMLGLRHTNRAWLQGMTPQLFNEFLSYLLGDFCYNLVGRSADGRTVLTPSWSQLLIYEFQIRKKALQEMVAQKGTFAQCLKSAWKDPVTKERYFTTPLALSVGGGLKRVYQADGAGESSSSKGKGKKGKKQKGQGKGKKGATNKSGCKPRTPDGRLICYAFNDRTGGCKNAKCSFLHVCGSCFGDHSMQKCPGNSQKPETAGSGKGAH
jgi:hypothetical protein